MKTIFFIMIFCPGFLDTTAQTFNRGEQSLIPASQLIIENYTKINLAPELIADAKANRFDINNASTYLQVLTDNSGRKYHILLQSNMADKVSFLCISNNLVALFNKKDKPMFGFNHCMNEVNSLMSARQNIEAAINCITTRLEYCNN